MMSGRIAIQLQTVSRGNGWPFWSVAVTSPEAGVLNSLEKGAL